MSRKTDWSKLESHISQGREAPACLGYADALAEHPDSVLARLRLGHCYARTDRIGDAERLWRETLELLDARPDALRQEVLEHLGPDARIADVLPHGDALAVRTQLLLMLAEACEKQGKISEAVAVACEVLENEPRCGPAYRLLSHLAWLNEDYDQAIGLAHGAILVDPGVAARIQSVCDYLVERDRLEDAVVLCRLVLSEGHQTPAVHNELGKIYLVKAKLAGLRADLLDRALDHLTRSLELDPDQPEVQALSATVKDFVARRASLGASSIRRSVVNPVDTPEVPPSLADVTVADLSVADPDGDRAAPTRLPAASDSSLPRSGGVGLSEAGSEGISATTPAAVQIAHPMARTSRLSRMDWARAKPPAKLAPKGRAGAISEMPD